MLSAEQNPGVISLDAERERRQSEIWARYIVARDAAERTGDIEHGIAAGFAWRAWLDTFQSTSQLEADREFQRVLAFRRRATGP